jgi:hypothetical protein
MKAYQRSSYGVPFDWCLHHQATQRFHHRDIPELTCEQLWAEATVLNGELARLLAGRDRPRVLGLIGGALVSDQDWIRVRLTRLKKELRRRRRARG